MLDPIYYQIDSETQSILADNPDIRYWIMGYAKYNEYVLIRWALGNDDEYFAGEKLFYGQQLIVSAGGSIGLESRKPNNDESSNAVKTVRNRLVPGDSEYGLSNFIAMQLIDPANYVFL
jgi:hypothetical protein